MNVIHNAIFDPALNSGAGGWRSMKTTDLGGGGGGGGLTNTELRAAPVPMIPRMLTGGNSSANVVSATPVVLASQACYQVTVFNPSTNKVVNVLQGGNGIPVQPGGRETLFGITNANVLSVVTADGSALVVPYRWEG